ncbi:MAG: hypothetical protein GF307_09690 [candidate division Zixibacteria bacterium]|nr:hypothetical protein [candidate division Zixibacteria bacterium]
MIKYLSKWYIRIPLALIILYYLGRVVISNFNNISMYNWQFDWIYIVLSLIIVLVNYFWLINIWRLSLKHFGGVNLNIRTAYKIWAYSSLGKYIPGKIWAVAGMIVLVEKQGVKRSDAIVTALIYQYLNVTAGFLISFLGAVLYFREWLAIEFLIAGIPLLILLAYPPLISYIINFVSKVLKYEGTSRRLSYSMSLYYLIAHFISWLIYGLAFFFFFNGIMAADSNLFLPLTAVFAGSYIIGFLSIFVPSGIGVREGIMSASLAKIIPSEIAVSISLVARAWLTVAELIMYSALIFVRKEKLMGN